MKFLFLDEFKFGHTKGAAKVYGVVGVLIDSTYYASFKDSFRKELERIGWDKNLELKGRSMFSSKGDEHVKAEDRINFMTKVVGLSQSTTGKTARIHVYVSFDVFDGKQSEIDCYQDNLCKIIKKIPSPSSKKKNLIAVLYDNNDCIVDKAFTSNLNKLLEARKLKLFESAISVRSSLDSPGIMFADYVCYFHQNFLQLSKFRKDNTNEFSELIDKYENKSISDAEGAKLDSYITNYKKEKKTKELISSLKKIVYV